MQCPKCSMTYMAGLVEDENGHSEYCDSIVYGPPIRTIAVEDVLWTNADDRIVLVTDASPEELRKLAHQTSICANVEMHYDGGIFRYNDPPDDRRVQIVLYIRSNRSVGFLLFERRAEIWRCEWNGRGTPICSQLPNIAFMWSVGFIWVHKEHRKVGIALRLLEQAKVRLHLGFDDVAWYTPFSEDGEAFVRRLYPIYFFVAK